MGPAPYQPPRPPKQDLSGWATTGICVGGVFGFILLLGVLFSGGDDSGDRAGKPAAVSEAPEAESKPDSKPADAKP